MRRTRSEYLAEVRNLLKSQKVLAASRLADQYFTYPQTHFLSELRKLSTRGRLPTVIDNINTPEGVANAFKEDFDRLLTKLPNTTNEITIKSRLLDNLFLKEQFVLFTDEVRLAFSHLCANKWDGERKINSSTLKHAPMSCCYTWLVSSTLCLTGNVPQDLKVNTIFPLLKQATLDCSLKSNY